MTQGYVLKIPVDRVALFEEYTFNQLVFGEPVSMFSINRNFPFLLFISTKDKYITHFGAGTGGLTAGSGMRRMNIDDVIAIDPISFSTLVKACSRKVSLTILKSLQKGGVVPPESFKAMLAGLVHIEPELENILGLYQRKKISLKEFSKARIQSLADQKEAISTALQLTDIDRKPLQSWNLANSGNPSSFLDGLDSAYLREDQMITYDMSFLPGFDMIKQSHFSRAQFKSKTEDVFLDVIVANRTLMEEQTGADLIYYNEIYRSFIFVQYKAMENESGIGDLFRLPDRQLAKEIETMHNLLLAMGDEKTTHRSHFRFSYNPFFIKLCPRVVFNPDDIKLTPGMYFNLDHWGFLEKDKDLVGKKGGRYVSFKNVGRHITNTDFAVLVKHSWIGTTPVQSNMIEALIDEILSTGKSIVYAVKRDWSVMYEHLKNDYFDRRVVGDEDDLPF